MEELQGNFLLAGFYMKSPSVFPRGPAEAAGVGDECDVPSGAIWIDFESKALTASMPLSPSPQPGMLHEPWLTLEACRTGMSEVGHRPQPKAPSTAWQERAGRGGPLACDSVTGAPASQDGGAGGLKASGLHRRAEAALQLRVPKRVCVCRSPSVSCPLTGIGDTF